MPSEPRGLGITALSLAGAVTLLEIAILPLSGRLLAGRQGGGSAWTPSRSWRCWPACWPAAERPPARRDVGRDVPVADAAPWIRLGWIEPCAWFVLPVMVLTDLLRARLRDRWAMPGVLVVWIGRLLLRPPATVDRQAG